MSRLNPIRPAVNALVALSLLCLCVNPVLANTRHVPADYPTIQAAIVAAVDGDEILVASGEYNETIRFLGKTIIVRSSDGPGVTTIDGTGFSRSVVSFVDGEEYMAVLDGFTITGGTGFPFSGKTRGGGVLIEDSSPTIKNCAIVGNTAGFGGGLYIDGASHPWIVESLITGNVATEYGGAIHSGGVGGENEPPTYVTLVQTTVEENIAPYAAGMRSSGFLMLLESVVKNNSAETSMGGISIVAGTLTAMHSTFEGNNGRAVTIGPKADATFDGCTFINHPAGAISAWTLDEPATLILENCTFANNVGLQGAAIAATGLMTIDIVGSTFDGNATSGSGGALRVICQGGVEAKCPQVTITDSSFADNSAGGSGGAVSLDCAAGALSADCPQISVQNSSFIRSHAKSYGGAFNNRCVDWVDPVTNEPIILCGKLSVSSSVLKSNYAGSGGGAIANLSKSSTTLQNTAFCRNVPQHILGDWDDAGGNSFATPADITCDGQVGVPDLLKMLAEWGECQSPAPWDCPADLNGSGSVGVADLLILLSKWD